MNLCKVPEIVEDKGAWRTTVYGIAKSWTWLSDWTTTAKFSGGEEFIGMLQKPGYETYLVKSPQQSDFWKYFHNFNKYFNKTLSYSS